MKASQFRQNTAAVLAALIWGTAMAAQSVCARYISASFFTAVRFWIATAVLGLAAWFVDRARRAKDQSVERDKKALLWGGGLCGTLLAAAAVAQQAGLSETAAGKAGFITALYIVIVPVLGLFLHKKVPTLAWAGMAVAVAGLYCLCVTGELTIAPSDGWIILCAFLFSMQILAVDRFSGRVDPLELALVQAAAAAFWATVCTLVTGGVEPSELAGLRLCLWPMLYMGVLSSGLAYLLQAVAQQDSNPTVISLLLSLESVFAALAGAILLGDRLSGREYLGCVLMMAAMVLAQLPPVSEWKWCRRREREAEDLPKP